MLNRPASIYSLTCGCTLILSGAVADVVGGTALDAAMVVQLSRVYGLPLTRSESGRLVAVISTQLAALMGAVWGMQLASSALKGLSGGLSVVVTAAAQGALHGFLPAATAGTHDVCREVTRCFPRQRCDQDASWQAFRLAPRGAYGCGSAPESDRLPPPRA